MPTNFELPAASEAGAVGSVARLRRSINAEGLKILSRGASHTLHKEVIRIEDNHTKTTHVNKYTPRDH
jgi:hypothetical protein